MSEEIKQELDQVLEDLKDELRDKPQGYATEIPIAQRLFPETEPPRIQVVLLDPEEDKVAFRRVSDLLQGERKSDWHVGELEEVIDDALSWEVELEETEDLIEENMNEDFEE
jgi:hypothetical protein